jgi:hypothetical protein
MRTATLVLSVFLTGLLGCGTTSGTGGSDKGYDSSSRTTPDGLVEVDTEGPGHLFLRKDHGIGGYDAIAVAPSFVSYQRNSARIDPEDEEVYLVSMEQAIIDAARANNVEVVNEIGNCVIKVGGGFVNVQLADSAYSDELGRMTLVIEYQDSMSGESLLRYYAEEKIGREPEGVDRADHIARNFDRMISEMNPIESLRAATAVASKPRPGCGGKLIDAGPTTAASS